MRSMYIVHRPTVEANRLQIDSRGASLRQLSFLLYLTSAMAGEIFDINRLCSLFARVNGKSHCVTSTRMQKIKVQGHTRPKKIDLGRVGFLVYLAFVFFCTASKFYVFLTNLGVS